MFHSIRKNAQNGAAVRGGTAGVSDEPRGANGALCTRNQRRLAIYPPGCAFLLFAALEIRQVPPETALWATPAILFAAMMIAWAAESAQFFVAQGFALAILAWLQTLPEFAVEAVLAWKQQVPLLLANLTGALRLLTGLGWPMIYFTAALFYRLKSKRPLNKIELDEEHSVEVMGLFAPLIYASYIWYKATLDLSDAAILILIYVAYLWILSKMPAHDPESIEALDRIPRAVVQAKPRVRNAAIVGLFAAGGAVIYFAAEPFLGSLLAVSAAIGVPSFVFVQWVAPFVSEFPEKVSAFYWAKTVHKAPMALMNMVSSNINQWTLLAAMLPIVFSWSRGEPSAIPFDETQELEILMTIGQSLVGMIFLVNMKLVWWEASALFGLWFIQFAFSAFHNAEGTLGFLATHIHWYVTVVYLVWAAAGLLGFLIRPRTALAFQLFGKMWRTYVRPRQAA